MKIVADNKIPFLEGALEPYAEVVYLPGKEITRDIIADADAMLIRTRTKCNEQLLRDTKVRFIGTATIGFDHIDTRYCAERNIIWTNAPGCNSSSVQQYITSALFTIASGHGFNLMGKTLGIIGVGNVGTKVAKIGKVVGMNILLNDPPRARKEGSGGFVGIERILRESDIITLHVPLTMAGADRTFHLFDETILKKMKAGSWLFNSSRGEVVDTPALRSMLESSVSGGAVIDVWENEPEIDRDLLSLTTLATPHIAGYSTDGKANGTAMVVNSMSRFFNLPLDNWFPGNVPQPESSEIVIDGRGKTEEGIIGEAILHTYNIREDDEKFRYSPSDFEKLRGDYPLRREFTTYTVRLAGSSRNLRSLLKEIGFRIDR